MHGFCCMQNAVMVYCLLLCWLPHTHPSCSFVGWSSFSILPFFWISSALSPGLATFPGFFLLPVFFLFPPPMPMFLLLCGSVKTACTERTALQMGSVSQSCRSHTAAWPQIPRWSISARSSGVKPQPKKNSGSCKRTPTLLLHLVTFVSTTM